MRFTEKICAAVIPIVAIIEALILAVSGCFDCEKLSQRKKSRCGYQEIARLSEESRCKAIRRSKLLLLFSVEFEFWNILCLFTLVQSMLHTRVFSCKVNTYKTVLDLISY